MRMATKKKATKKTASKKAPPKKSISTSKAKTGNKNGNVSGRLTSLAVDPRDSMCLFVGAAGGGVWRSKDGGRNWETRWDKLASLNIGSLAIDPQFPDIVYCGTGEANLSADSYPGAGVY